MAATRTRSRSASGSGSTTCPARRSACRSRGWRPPRRFSPAAPLATGSEPDTPKPGISPRATATGPAAAGMTAARGGLRRFFLDTAPLRLDRDFRWLWTGQAINGIGSQITRLALPYQVYVLTGSTLAIAALTLFQLIPILIFSLGAGSIADAVDRRRMLRITQIGLMACSATLAILAFQPSVPLPLLFGVAFVSAAFSSLDQPARSSAIPRLVARERLPAAIALGQLNFQIASVVGPTVAGILIATVGLSGAYLVDVVTFTASLVALTAIGPLPPLAGAARPGLAAIGEGLRFAWRRRVILATYVIDLDAMV